MNLQALSTRRGKRVLILVTCVIVAGLALGVCVPSLQESRKLDAETAELTVQAAAVNQQADKLAAQQSGRPGGGPDAAAQIAKRNARAAKIAVPAKFQSDEVYANILALAEHTDAKVTGFSPSASTGDKQTGPYTKVPVTMNVSCGDFASCVRFIGGLNGMVTADKGRLTAKGPLWHVDSLSLTPGRPLTAMLTGGMYVRQAPAAPEAQAQNGEGAQPDTPQSDVPPEPAPQPEGAS